MSKFIFSMVSIVAALQFATLAMADHSHEYEQASRAYSSGDYQTAFHLWKEAAAKGEPAAQESLGAMYATGKGTSQNYAEAAMWYRKAAEQGKISAQYSLGNLYYKGLGIEKSLERAYAWWLISAATGNTEAKNKLRTILAEMSPGQRKQARTLAVQILEKLAE